MSTFQQRLNDRMKALNIKAVDIVNNTSASKASVSQWVNGISAPSAVKGAELASFLQCNLLWLLEGEGEQKAPLIPEQTHVAILEDHKNNEETHLEIKRYDIRLSAGAGNAAWIVREKDDDPLLFRRGWFRARNLNPNRLKGLYVRGDSMEPYLYGNDTVIIDVDDTEIEDGEVYAIIFKNKFYVKELRNFENGVRIISRNPSYEMMEAKAEDLTADDFQVLGKVVWRGG